MRLTPPKFVTWLVAVALVALAVIGYIVNVALPDPPSWLMHVALWLGVFGGAALAAGTALKGI